MARLRIPMLLKLLALNMFVFAFAGMPADLAKEPDLVSAPADMFAQCKNAVEQAAGRFNIVVRSVI